MGVTQYGIPYPEPTDPVRDVAAAIKALAVELDKDRADSGWTDCTIRAGFAWQGGIAAQVRKIGKRVTMRWGPSSTGMTANSSFSVGDIPVGFRPAQDVYTVTSSSTGAASAKGVIRANGTIEVGTNATLGGYYLFAISWLVD